MAGIQQHAMSLSCFLGFMLRADGGCTRRVLLGLGVVHISHNEGKDNGNGGGGGDGNHIEDGNEGDDVVEKGKLLSSYLSCGIKQICRQECGVVQQQAIQG